MEISSRFASAESMLRLCTSSVQRAGQRNGDVGAAAQRAHQGSGPKTIAHNLARCRGEMPVGTASTCKGQSARILAANLAAAVGTLDVSD
jgi:hypothetical protein